MPPTDIDIADVKNDSVREVVEERLTQPLSLQELSARQVLLSVSETEIKAALPEIDPEAQLSGFIQAIVVACIIRKTVCQSVRYLAGVTGCAGSQGR